MLSCSKGVPAISDLQATPLNWCRHSVWYADWTEKTPVLVHAKQGNHQTRPQTMEFAQSYLHQPGGNYHK
jgi:hypothetical protein